MSRWLQNAATFLEKLDDTAGKVIVEQREKRFDQQQENDDDEDVGLLDSILAARGLHAIDDEDDDTNAWKEEDIDLDGSLGNHVATTAMTIDTATTHHETDGTEESDMTPAKAHEHNNFLPETPFKTPRQLSTDPLPEEESQEDASDQDNKEKEEDRQDDVAKEGSALDPTATQPLEIAATVPRPPPPLVEATSSAPEADAPPPSNNNNHQQLMVQAQKEIRTLKRHVKTLNQQLEASEREIEAHRQELDSAGTLMGKERAKFKLEKDKLMEQHQAELREIKRKHEEQVKEIQFQITTLNEQRAQEGGNWSKDLEDALEREKETLQRLAMIQDEKDTLQQHIDTLQHQQQALGSRLESLTETADSAMERERQAENRLDEILSAHARQIQQRQARETELEKTVSELGAALVKARDGIGLGASDQAGILQSSTSDMMIESLKAEMETIQSQLSQEIQRNKIMHDELRAVSSDHTDEAAFLQIRREQHDRQVEELNQTILRLKKELRQKETINAVQRGGDEADTKQIQSLSEEVIRLREKVSSSSSESSALRSRLQVALERAKRAEHVLEEKMSSGATGSYLDVEMAGNGTPRQRGGRVKGHPTMRAALKLDNVQGEQTERIAKSLDSLDAFLTQSGKFLRHNPVARLFFILYFLLMHLWTFALLFFHVHGYETMHGDFGSGAHGPSGLLSQGIPQVVGQVLQDKSGE